MKINYTSGVGGWLSLLIVGFMVLSPLYGFGNLHTAFSDATSQYPQLLTNSRWTTYVQITWLLFAGFTAFGIAAGYRLWKIHKKDSVQFAIMSLWAIGPVAKIAHFITGVVALNKDLSSDVTAAFLGEFVASCITAGIWTLYLLRSARVQNTYK